MKKTLLLLILMPLFCEAQIKTDFPIKFTAVTSMEYSLKNGYGQDKELPKSEIIMDGIVVAPGFGQRGIEGKFIAIHYARTHDIPTFGICLGMQCMVIEFARNVLGYKDANSTEMEPTTTHKVIDLMEEQKSVTNMSAKGLPGKRVDA